MIPIDLKNQVAIVTGASSGIGAGIAKILARAGCHISACALSEPDSPEVGELIRTVESAGRIVYYERSDLTKSGDIKSFVRNTIVHFGQIDILVSNAGMNVFKGAEMATEEDWEFNMDLNLRSHWRISKECKPWLEKSPNGVILINSSNHAFNTIPGCFPYNVSKAALSALVHSLAIEWGPGIRTVGIAPGFIEVESNLEWFENFPDPQAEWERTLGRHPAGKMGSTEEVGAFCAFLASEYAGFITGATYLMDGGRSAIMQDES